MAHLTGIPLKFYEYYDASTKGVNFQGMLKDIKAADAHSLILLHACAHNPTGCDLTSGQWEELLEVVKSKEHIPFIDMAY